MAPQTVTAAAFRRATHSSPALPTILFASLLVVALFAFASRPEGASLRDTTHALPTLLQGILMSVYVIVSAASAFVAMRSRDEPETVEQRALTIVQASVGMLALGLGAWSYAGEASAFLGMKLLALATTVPMSIGAVVLLQGDARGFGRALLVVAWATLVVGLGAAAVWALAA